MPYVISLGNSFYPHFPVKTYRLIQKRNQTPPTKVHHQLGRFHQRKHIGNNQKIEEKE